MKLRPAEDADLAFILALEEREDVAPWIVPWTPEAHLATFDDPDRETLILVADVDGVAPGIREGDALGFAILSGLASPHRAIELTRIVLARPGEGLGRVAVVALLQYCFAGEGAHRLWLDVFEDNVRARRLYGGLGFSEEGALRDAVFAHDRFRTLVVMAMLEDDPVIVRLLGRIAESGSSE